ncbi:MAG: YqgE/AlgH family protein [Candidatus Binatia bacterium]
MKRLFVLALALVLGFGGAGRNPAAGAEEEQHLIGQFLVATREMADPRFAESVIYMIRHDRTGAMGLVINRPFAEGPLSDLLKALGQKGEGANGTVRIHFGGPVEPERLFILHSNDYAARATMFVGNGLGVSGDDDILQAIERGEGPRQKLFIFGYAGWAPGQLEEEIKSGAWFTIPTETALVFDDQAETKWDRAMAKRKVKT